MVETSDADFSSAKAQETIRPFLFSKKPPQPLIERVKAENRDALKDMASYVGVPLDVFDLMPAWTIPFFVFIRSAEAAEATHEYGYKYGVETVLEAEFAAMNKPILSIEDPNQILEALSSMPENEQLELVDAMLSDWQKDGPAAVSWFNPVGEKGSKQVSSDYSADIEWAKGSLNAADIGLSAEELGEGFYDILVTDRNRAWTDWLVERLKKPGKILVAVGSGHFIGEDALLKMLSAKGLEVKRIQ